MLLIPQ